MIIYEKEKEEKIITASMDIHSQSMDCYFFLDAIQSILVFSLTIGCFFGLITLLAEL